MNISNLIQPSTHIKWCLCMCTLLLCIIHCVHVCDKLLNMISKVINYVKNVNDRYSELNIIVHLGMVEHVTLNVNKPGIVSILLLHVIMTIHLLLLLLNVNVALNLTQVNSSTHQQKSFIHQ